MLASRGIRPRETSSLRRPRGLPEQARACSRIARGTDAPPLLRHAGLPRARTQAPSTGSLRTSAQPFPGTRPSPRPVVGDLGRLGGRESREAVPRDPASPRPTGRGRSRRCRHRRPSGLPVGVRPSRDMPCRHRTAPARRHPCRHESRAAALAHAVGRLREAGHPLGHLSVVVSLERASPRLAVLGRRRAYRCGSRVAADSEVCTIDGHGDPPVGRGVSAPFCRNGTILAHGRSPWDHSPE